jgi:hypothetical protein
MTWQSTKPPISPTITKKELAQHWGIETEVPKKNTMNGSVISVLFKEITDAI